MTSKLSRRQLLVGALGMSVPFLRYLPDELIPVALPSPTTDSGYPARTA